MSLEQLAFYDDLMQLQLGEAIIVKFNCALSKAGVKRFQELLNTGTALFFVKPLTMATRSFRPRGYWSARVARIF